MFLLLVLSSRTSSSRSSSSLSSSSPSLSSMAKNKKDDENKINIEHLYRIDMLFSKIESDYDSDVRRKLAKICLELYNLKIGDNIIINDCHKCMYNDDVKVKNTSDNIMLNGFLYTTYHFIPPCTYIEPYILRTQSGHIVTDTTKSNPYKITSI